jgi:hypothetical protein
MTKQIEDLTFSFPEDWSVTQYDEWQFYKNRFKDCCTGNKGVDLLVLDPDTRTLWLLEVKDYRRHARENPLPIWEDVARKIRDTLAGLAATKFNPDYLDERRHANRCLNAQRLRVVFHIEQPVRDSKLFRRAYDLADIQ